jgi:hypothetical protein
VTEQVRALFRWFRYAEYVATWEEIPVQDRPWFRVVRRDGDWIEEVV